QPAVNVRWTASLGHGTYADPVVANGLLWIGTNNYGIGDNSNAKEKDASILECFRIRDGRLLYRYFSPRLSRDLVHDWPPASLTSSPLIEGERLWFTTNRCETVCLDIGPLYRGTGEPQILWKMDMMNELGVYPRGADMGIVHYCSVAGYRKY